MNYNKILAIIFTSFVFLSSCNNTTELSNSIPADASYVVYVNNKSLVEKSEYDVFSNPTVLKGINVYKALLGDEAKVKVIDEFFKNSNSLGLNLKEETYFYTNFREFGMIMGVNDSKRIEKLLSDFSVVSASEIKKEGDAHYIIPESQICIAWDNKKMILLLDIASAYGLNNESKSISLKDKAIAQLTQPSDKSINNNKSFVEFAKGKKDISAFYSMDGIADFMNEVGSIGFAGGLFTPSQELLSMFKGVSFGGDVSFEKGEVVSTMRYYFASPEQEKKFKELSSTMAGTLKGDHFKYIESDPLLLAAFNVKGKGVYQYLNDWGLMSKLADNLTGIIQSDDVKTIIQNFTGDVTFAFTNMAEIPSMKYEYDEYEGTYIEKESTKPIAQCVLFADVKDPNYLMSLIKNKLGLVRTPFTEVNETSIMVNADGMDLYIGTKDNIFYVTNMKSMLSNLENPNSKNNYAEQIKNQAFYMTGDFMNLKSFLKKEDDLTSVLSFLSVMNKYHFGTSIVDLKGKGSFEFVNKDKNSLAVICDEFDKLITNYPSSFNF